ncbi:ArnT family glycosyltransferase [Methylacidimicrobium tartarophylax]|uniref:4-amino-4-deoxy-L-arabinose transferase n=1 Tax=Methylacidimicrobium tartarophylax TaxID=1041768 RepID=A0A5E6ME09_9BACT|nr:glycosyltransferase family 39 protein [Methylacidimicrobium tartarophylax]VVM07799.1 4-amino-4-deoxy-L-arabinose transferase [Methylacidimicrobium tartarophylax]
MHRFRSLFGRFSLVASGSGGADVLGLFALLLLGALYVAESGSPVILDDNEGLYAGAAREMRARGDWILPTLDGMPRCQKPPLLYWLILLSTSLFGENEFAVRLPQALAALAWMAATYSFGATLGGRSHGWMAALILGTAFGAFIFGHILMPEIFLAASIAWSFLFLWKAFTEEEKRWQGIGFWLAIGFGTIAKGLHALFYPLVVLGILGLLSCRWRKVAVRLFRWEGIALFLCLVIPWYLVMERRLPGFLFEQFGNEQFGHALNRRIPPDAGTVRLPVFLSEQAIFLLPWSLFAAALWLPRRKTALSLPGNEKAGTLFLGLWILVTFLSLLPSSLQDYYALSCYPALALFLARPFCTAQEERPGWTFWTPFALIAGLAAGAGVAAIAFWWNTELAQPALGAAPVEARDTFLAAILGFPFRTWRAFVPLLLSASLSLFLGGLVGLSLARRGKRLAAGLCLALAMLLPLADAGRGFQLLEDYFSSVKIARYLNALPASERRIVADGEPNFFSSLFFYLQNRKESIYWVHSTSASSFVLQSWPGSRELYLSEEEFLEFWREEKPVYLICEQSAMNRWQPLFDRTTSSWKAVLGCGTRVLVVNRREAGKPMQ